MPEERIRNLASVQVIHKIEPIEGADSIELANVLGWQVVVKKGQFKPGDLCVYCEIDSKLPEKPEFEFLRSKKYRIKTVRLKGCLSQGICFGLEILPGDIVPEEGLDVTETLEVEKYSAFRERMSGGPNRVKQIPTDIVGDFPSYVPKTDEQRIQSAPKLLDELRGRPYYITEKVDGTSCTISYKQGEGLVCSRKWAKKDGPKSHFWQAAKRYSVLEKLAECACDYAIQGEVAGPGIQKNRLNLPAVDLFVFNVYCIDTGRYLNFKEFVEFCERMELQTVKVVEIGDSFEYDLPTLLDKAEGLYESGKQREGIVVRPQIEAISQCLKGGRLSFKVVNNKYLLKQKE